jgi:hypothetical protein
MRVPDAGDGREGLVSSHGLAIGSDRRRALNAPVLACRPDLAGHAGAPLRCGRAWPHAVEF